ncbi:uncharacterized protein BXZ73DRAFT_104299 [Epithele typhae]|uniref:uncharacterized protein n=1 Tax=Epithele typhae TaxID=378194 RepID=UPI0020088C29|nr:uncharacterized protein BXZ73DRAFT_104299 [Epithele typhae]KAH9921680.1 hypothetical protein BXZ73DRAFT_104299 [Epithele typhae]
MSAIGSVFLGDVQRLRHLSTSTPPSSPPPHGAPAAHTFSDADLDMDERAEVGARPAVIPAHASMVATAAISPALALELRLRWLETLLFGAKHDAGEAAGAQRSEKDKEKLKDGETLARRADDLQRRMNGVAQSSDALKRFMDRYEQYAHMLTPAFALAGTVNPPTYDNMTSTELEAFLAEMEPDIRSAERDLREINALETKGVTGAGKLGDYEALQPRLEGLLKAHDEDLHTAADLERRIALLMDHYATSVDTLSELFVSWDETIRETEDEINELDKDLDERRKLGYE